MLFWRKFLRERLKNPALREEFMFFKPNNTNFDKFYLKNMLNFKALTSFLNITLLYFGILLNLK